MPEVVAAGAIDAPAVLLRGPRQLAADTIAVPPPGPGEARVAVAAVGLCASDLSLYHGTYAAPNAYPICFGHEWAGVVEAVGPGTTKVREGDLVTGDCSLWCGECDRCGHDLNLCRHITKLGLTVDGAARSHLCVAERHLHHAPAGATPALTALAEPLAVSAHAIAHAEAVHHTPVADARVLVLGAGTLGLGALLLLRHHWGCREVAIADLSAARRERAIELGGRALEVAAAATGDGYDALYADDGYDLVLETTGAAAALEQAIDLLAPAGTIAALGFVEQLTFAPRLLTLKAARLIGSIGGSGHFDVALDLIGAHADELARMVTDTFPIDDAEAAFAAASDRDSALKVQLEVSSR